MAVDLIAGNRLELPWLGGRVRQIGREHGIPTPASARNAGIDIVPFFVFNGKVAVPGAHEAKVLLEAIEQATTEAALAVE